jgi:hypothetical protein
VARELMHVGHDDRRAPLSAAVRRRPGRAECARRRRDPGTARPRARRRAGNRKPPS